MPRYSKYMFNFFVFVIIFSIFCFIGDGGFLRSGLVEAKVSQNTVVFDKANPNIQAVMAVQNRHTPGLMANPDVVGTGVGLTEDGKPAIVVYTLLPVKAIPNVIEGVPVIVKITGRIIALADTTARFPRPVPTGVSTGHPDITAGTIGCRVKDEHGNVYALSNNHVYANCNKASIGDNVLQPGMYDGGIDPDDTIGALYDFEPIRFNGKNNTIDAAIAISDGDFLGCSTPTDGYGTPSSTTEDAQIGMAVQKYGRTTGLTHGTVDGLNVTVSVCYECADPFCYICKKSAKFVNQFTITPGGFSLGGDSGSLIVTDYDTNKNPVGLLFAGSSTTTIANPIDAVLDRFGVTVDAGFGGNSPPAAEFTYTTSELTAYFTDTSTDSDGTIVSWNWDFGDGDTSTVQNPSHTYAASGTYTVTLTVTDNDGATNSVSKPVMVTNDVNNNPVADFTYATINLTAYFTDTSTDSDGTIASWNWNFSDGETSTDQNPSHTYADSGTYTVTLTVTDNDGAIDSVSKPVTVTVSSEILLTATGYKRGVTNKVDLVWSGATSELVDIKQNGDLVSTTANDGFYTDNLGKNASGTYTYIVCDVGTGICSNEATVTF